MKRILTHARNLLLMAAVAIIPVAAQTLAADEAKSKKITRQECRSTRNKKSARTATPGKESLLGRHTRKNCKNLASGLAIARNGKMHIHRAASSSESSEIPRLMGAVIYADSWNYLETEPPYGIYDVSTPVPLQTLSAYASGYGTVYKDGNIYFIDEYEDNGMVYVTVYGYDAATGEQLFAYPGDLTALTAGLALDPTSGDIYGIGFNEDASEFRVAKYTFTDDNLIVEPIATVDGDWNSFAIDSAGNFYGIRYILTPLDNGELLFDGAELCSIGRTDGEVSVIGNTDVEAYYQSAATIDPRTDTMYWTISDNVGGYLSTVDLTTGKATVLFAYEDGEEVGGLYIPESVSQYPAAPVASLEYVDGKMNVSWNAVTTTVDGGALSDTAVTYTVVRSDDTVAAEGLTDTTFSEELTAPEDFTAYYYTVYAVINTGNEQITSAAGKTNVITLGAITPPYKSDFKSEGLIGYTILDANTDGTSWQIYDNTARIGWSKTDAMDDWMITPPFRLEAGTTYYVTFNTWNYAPSYPERLEVKYGNGCTAEEMTETLLPVTELTTYSKTTPLRVKKTITPAESGVYYIGFHGLSDADSYFLSLSNISISDTPDDDISEALPDAVYNVKISRTATEGEVHLTWDAVTEDVDGNPLSPELLSYRIYSYEGGAMTLVAEDISGTSYTYQAVAAGDQEFVQLAVCAVTATGEGAACWSPSIAVGTPYAQFTESFADGHLKYILGATGDCEAAIYSDSDVKDIVSADGDNGFIAFEGVYRDDSGWLYTGMVNLAEVKNPAFSFYTYNLGNYDEDLNEIRVVVEDCETGDYTEALWGTVASLCNNNPGWNEVNVNLDAYAGQTVQIKIYFEVKNYAFTLFDRLSVYSALTHNLQASAITAPIGVLPGENFSLSLTVSNVGGSESGAYSVELYRDGVIAASKEGAPLASGAEALFTFDEVMPVTATTPLTYYGRVVYTPDEDPADNDSKTIEVKPLESALPAATDLKAEGVEGGIKLQWDAPLLENLPTAAVTDDFEDADAFADRYGDWIFADGDKKAVGGFEDFDIPGINPSKTEGSFWIWDHSQLGNGTFAAHSGEKYLFALYRYDDGTTDDWAISPLLSGAPQTISFYARSYDSTYPEAIEVYYTEGGTGESDFIKVAGTEAAMQKVPSSWTLYSVALPRGARRFAIRSCATASFMLMVDDVTYSPAGSGASLLGYDIYRNGDKLNDKVLTENSYFDETVTNGSEYSYNVVAAYDLGYSPLSNTVTITFMGSGIITQSVDISILTQKNLIKIINSSGSEVNVSTMDGTIVYSGTSAGVTEISVPSGIYIVKAGEKITKVII